MKQSFFILTILTLVASGCNLFTQPESISDNIKTDYSIGDRGPAGGIVFYDKSDSDGGWRYLEAWTTDEGTYQWKTSNTNTYGTATAIGSGFANTYTAMIGSQYPIIIAHPAAEICRIATHGGYTNWHLPSSDELTLMYEQRAIIGGFDDIWGDQSYWSSSESSTSWAYFQYFYDDGFQSSGLKESNMRIRAIRAF